MSEELESVIEKAKGALQEEGFDQGYIDAAVNSYRQYLPNERESAAERGMRLAVSPPSKVTSVASVDDPHPKQSIGWQSCALNDGEPVPGGWVVVDD